MRGRKKTPFEKKVRNALWRLQEMLKEEAKNSISAERYELWQDVAHKVADIHAELYYNNVLREIAELQDKEYQEQEDLKERYR